MAVIPDRLFLSNRGSRRNIDSEIVSYCRGLSVCRFNSMDSRALRLQGVLTPVGSPNHPCPGESPKQGGSPILPRRARSLAPTPEMDVSGVVSRRIWARSHL